MQTKRLCPKCGGTGKPDPKRHEHYWCAYCHGKGYLPDGRRHYRIAERLDEMARLWRMAGFSMFIMPPGKTCDCSKCGCALIDGLTGEDMKRYCLRCAGLDVCDDCGEVRVFDGHCGCTDNINIAHAVALAYEYFGRPPVEEPPLVGTNLLCLLVVSLM
jgi:hypothetical protein